MEQSNSHSRHAHVFAAFREDDRPVGNIETVYTFENCKVNKISLIWDKPFQPPRIGYKYNIRKNQPAAAIVKNGTVVPSTIGMTAEAANKVITQSGYEVEWKRGQPAQSPKLKYVVYEQEPGPRKPLNKGEKVTLTVYDAPQQQAPNRTKVQLTSDTNSLLTENREQLIFPRTHLKF